MKRLFLLLFIWLVLMTLTACGRSGEEAKAASSAPEQSGPAEMQTERSIEELREQCPEYFEISDFKGVEVYVWETAEGTYRCGIMSGTNRMKTASEIRALEERSLSVAEAKAVLEELGVKNDGIFIIPITQPYMNNAGDDSISEPYIFDEEYAEQIRRLFTDK